MTCGSLKANALIEELGIDDPSILIQHLDDICMARGVYVRQGHLDGAEARLTVGSTDGELKGVILVNPNDSYETRTRFSIAHELGHFELHKDISSSISCNERALNDWFGKQAHQRREIEANEFASELLLPEIFVDAEINGDEKPSLNLVEKLASKYQASFFASARRFIDLTEEACALVFFNKGQILYHFRSNLFQQQGYWIAPGPLEPASMAYDAAKEGKNGTYMSTVDAGTWIDTSDKKDWQRRKIEEAEILEQALYFPRLDMGVSLLWIHKGDLIWN